jgi:single-stranded-DNA-specific exonuclease
VVEPRFRWILAPQPAATPGFLAAATEAGLGDGAIAVLLARGIQTPGALASFLAEPRAALHDPRALPDAERLVARVALAASRGEPVMVFGDFDADGLTGLAILIMALRSMGIEAIPYVPGRLDEGHGLSMAAVDAAGERGVGLIVTVDTGSTSHGEIAQASGRGIDVVVTDHHRVPATYPPAVAFVNPHRPDAAYPDDRLAGSGVAFKVAQLLLAEAGHGDGEALAMADLATIGTVADLAPILGENRAIAQLGLECLRTAPRPGVAALLDRAGVRPDQVDLERVAFALAPRLNAAGRVGEVDDAARLLLADDPEEAARLAETLEADNSIRRDLTRQVVAEAREAAFATADHAVSGGIGDALRAVSAPAVVVRGPWPVGIIGLVAARLAEEAGRPAIVGAELGDVIRASCRSAPGFDLAAALEVCADLLLRHGGHAGAAGFEVEASRWEALRDRLLMLAAAAGPPDPRPALRVDVALPAAAVDYVLVRDVARLAPFGPGHPDPLVAVLDIGVGRVRAASGGHTQLVLKRDRDVLDGIAFGRDDLVGRLVEGDRIDVVARVASRSFAGIESLQLEIRDVAAAGTVERSLARDAWAAAQPAAMPGEAAEGSLGSVGSTLRARSG